MKYLCNDSRLKERRRELRMNMTQAERKLWERLRGRRFFGLKFYRQYSIGSFILDFYCPGLRFGIELDGSHHGSADGKVYDVERDTLLKALGASLIRFENCELDEIESVLKRVGDFATSLLRSRGNEGVTK